MISLFEINETDDVVLNPELRLIKQFKKLIERDRGSKGDAQGRKKYRAIKELAFIYFMCDYNSRYLNVPETERVEQIVSDLDIDNFKVDEDIREAMDKYVELQETPSLKILNEIKETLFTCHKLSKILRDQIEKDIAAGKHNESYLDDKGRLILGTTTLIENLKNVLTISDAIPKTIDTMTKLEDKVKKEIQQDSRIRGGGKRGEYED